MELAIFGEPFDGFDLSATATGGQAVNGLSSTPYNIAVGGTQFMDTSSPGTPACSRTR